MSSRTESIKFGNSLIFVIYRSSLPGIKSRGYKLVLENIQDNECHIENYINRGTFPIEKIIVRYKHKHKRSK